ncbi:MAG: carboxypeptidase-like regulatory domain-containing protein, partial [Tannerella sp.]|nr:carboxypeptidase-like regulatory domain-containing protein [Tannerella sp.]
MEKRELFFQKNLALNRSIVRRFGFFTCFFVCAFISVQHVVAQTKTVGGTVADDSGNSVPGVNVIVKGTSNGVITDHEGNYSIKNVEASSVLLFSYVGYVPEEVLIGNRTVINITLKEDTQALDEVVVVGYGTQRKKDLTGSIVSISTEELGNMP